MEKWESPKGSGFVRTLFRPGVPGCEGLLIADLHHSPFSPERRDAVGALIAAAPDLYAALVNLDTLLDFGLENVEAGSPMMWPDDPSLLLQRFREARDALDRVNYG
jgi:hypothetical protein